MYQNLKVLLTVVDSRNYDYIALRRNIFFICLSTANIKCGSERNQLRNKLVEGDDVIKVKKAQLFRRYVGMQVEDIALKIDCRVESTRK